MNYSRKIIHLIRACVVILAFMMVLLLLSCASEIITEDIKSIQITCSSDVDFTSSDEAFIKYFTSY